jgi:hypothetical protein
MNCPRFAALFIGLFLCAPAALDAHPTVLIDAIPAAGTFIGLSPIGLPFKDAGTANPKVLKEGLNGAISRMLSDGERKGVSFICLLSPSSDDPVPVFILAALGELKLSRTNTSITVLFYRGGHESLHPPAYTLAAPPAGKAKVSMNIKKISVPSGVTTAGWMYFNLSRMQAEAEKAGSPFIFLQSGGTGKSVPVIIPGLKEPLMAYDDDATFGGSWYMDPKMDAAHVRAAAGAPSPSGIKPAVPAN